MSSSTANSEYSEFEAICNISMMMQDALDNFPSIAVGAVVNGNVVYMNASGVTDTKNQQTSDLIVADINSTAYEIASISKTFLAILSLQCQERHIIDIQNDDINKFLSKRNIHISNPYFPKEMISIYHLLTHGSGLCDDESALSEGSPWRTNDMDYPHPLEYYVVNRIAQTTSIWSRINAPGRHYHYSNAGFTLLAFVLECASDMSLCDMLKEWILSPLGMNHTSYMLSEMKEMDGIHIAVPHEYGVRVGNYGIAEWPAGQIRSTLHDMLLYLQDLTSCSSRLISDECRQLLMPSSMTGGLAWWGRDATYGSERGNVWMHGGFMQGIRTHIYIWPPTSSRDGDMKGAIILTNGSSSYFSIERALQTGLGINLWDTAYV